MIGNADTYLLTQTTHRLEAVIELTARDKVGNGRSTLFQPGFKQPVLAVYSGWKSGSKRT